MLEDLISELEPLMATHNNDPLTYRGLLELLYCTQERIEHDELEHELMLNALDDEFTNPNA